jgi:drug/metabolite transporter (DMT)-like permease
MAETPETAVPSPARTPAPPNAAPVVAPVVTITTAYILIATLLLIRGVNWPIIKIGLDYIPPLWFAASRIGLGALTLFIILAFRRELRFPPREDWPIVLSLGILTMSLYLTLAHVGVAFIDAGRAAILAYTTPLWVTPAAILLLGERFSLYKLLGFLAGLAGIIALFDPLSFDWSQDDTLIGNGILLVAAMCWALAILHIRVHKWHSTPLQLAPWQLVVGVIPTSIVALILEPSPQFVWGWELGAIIFYNGCIATAWGSWALITVNRSLPAISTSMGVLGVPAMGLLFSIVLLNEPVTAALLIGVFLIFAGVALVAFSDQRRK